MRPSVSHMSCGTQPNANVKPRACEAQDRSHNASVLWGTHQSDYVSLPQTGPKICALLWDGGINNIVIVPICQEQLTHALLLHYTSYSHCNSTQHAPSGLQIPTGHNQRVLPNTWGQRVAMLHLWRGVAYGF
jgi:hypothetical protein